VQHAQFLILWGLVEFLQITSTQREVNFLYISTAPDQAIDLINVPGIQMKVKAWTAGQAAWKALQRNRDGGLTPKQNIESFSPLGMKYYEDC